ncbi:Major facilitator superfamily domain, general substrate transporter [Cynara cardunculus var. scolymus]|uniref:Major facilitator superfamily domain, general substrate transporter n=1 Tax=Cynara cardunculus var. scolymus TaxID=59895 RepID=A0A124SF81_CYNCS|nr:Major facilitator superfamily domain, general substrate transporter [Cynara cardunculus var. scolymus]
MVRLKEVIVTFFNNRWLVFVAAMWIQSCAGIGYLFGSISPVIKSSLNYNQKQVARLGVAKDLGDSVGFLAGSLSEVLPMWALLLLGAIQNFVGYGWVWLIVTGKAPMLPLWVMCLLIFIGTNGETYFNTVALVSCVQNFPKNRGPVVGILKGFAGLSGAILTQIYALVNSPDNASLIFMVAVGPFMVIIALMFIVRPVGGHRQLRLSDGSSFTLIYCVCLVLAAYLMGVMLVEDLVDLNQTIVQIFTAILFVLVVVPIGIPLWLTFSSDPRTPEEESLLSEPQNKEPERLLEHDPNEIIFSEVEDEKPREVDLLPASERQKRIAQLQSKLAQAAAEGAVRIKRRRGPHRGEDFDLTQALIKADFWLIFISLLLGSGSGLTVIDNLGQMSQDYAYPRPVTMAVAQAIMAVGHLFFAMGWPGAMYIGTLLIGLGYGAHWAIVPATASELFGLKKFGALYNFLTLANPAGSLVFSGLIASYIYDSEAEKQAQQRHQLVSNSTSLLTKLFDTNDDVLKCEGSVCFFLTYMIMSGLCIIAVILSLILVRRTKVVYQNLYGKTRS